MLYKEKRIQYSQHIMNNPKNPLKDLKLTWYKKYSFTKILNVLVYIPVNGF